MENCLFCKIVSGEIPSSKVYEDDQVLAFLDITQVTKGHTLVIPKNHCRNILDMPAETAQAVFGVIPQLSQRLVKATGAQGINLVNNSEEAAGQTVFHAHIHLLPRGAAGDQLSISFPSSNPSLEELAQLAADIRQEVGQ